MTHTETAKSILPCICIAAWTDRGLTDPACPRCNYAAEVAAALRREHVAALRWAKEAVYETNTIDGAALDELEDRIAARIAELEKEAEDG